MNDLSERIAIAIVSDQLSGLGYAKETIKQRVYGIKQFFRFMNERGKSYIRDTTAEDITRYL